MSDFSDGSKWSLVMNATANATVDGTLITSPIPAFAPSHLFSSSVIACQVTSSSAKNTWHKAGYLRQIIPAGFTTTPSFSESRKILLNTPTIINFLRFPSNYQVLFEVPSYFQNCTFNVWEFTG